MATAGDSEEGTDAAEQAATSPESTATGDASTQEGIGSESGQSAASQVFDQDAGSMSEAHPVEFPQASRTRAHSALPIERFADVSIELSVEIGRVTMPIGELLQLGEGAVVELERSVTEPVDVMAQGVRIASGEVVVIDDRFAVRITEIANPEESRDKGTKHSVERILPAATSAT